MHACMACSRAAYGSEHSLSSSGWDVVLVLEQLEMTLARGTKYVGALELSGDDDVPAVGWIMCACMHAVGYVCLHACMHAVGRRTAVNTP